MRALALVGSAVAVVALATFAGTLAACSSPSHEEDSVAEGRATRQTKKGAEFARCWTTNDGNTDDFFRLYTLSCRVSSAGLSGLGNSAVAVDATTSTSSVQSGNPGATPDQDVVVARVRKSDFPLKARVYGYWKLGEFTSTDYRTEVAIAETVTVDQPVIVKLPFDSWEVTLLNRLPNASVNSERYEVQAAPFITEQSATGTKTTFVTSVQTPFLVGVARTDLDVIVPQSGKLSLSLQGLHSPSTIDVTGPGVFVLDESGIRKATAAEEAEADGADAGPGPGPAVDGGGAAVDAGPAPANDASTVPTTCGNNGQIPCKDASSSSFCNAGTRFDVNKGTCVACGDAGQTNCFSDPRNYSSTSGSTCNAGTRFDVNKGTCVACGDAGETYCFSDPKNYSSSSGSMCNAGTRFDANKGTCVACGNAGETYCFNDPKNYSGSPICTAPAVYSNGSCK